MDTLWVLKSHSLQVSISPVDPPRLAIEDDLLHLVEFTARDNLWFLLNLLIDLVLWLFKKLVIVEESLLSIKSSPRISAFHELLDKPLEHWINLSIIQTLDLMCRNCKGALHLSTGCLNFLGELDFLAHGEVIFEFDIDIVVGASDTPAHTS
jgi:hypothetical protein